MQLLWGLADSDRDCISTTTTICKWTGLRQVSRDSHTCSLNCSKSTTWRRGISFWISRQTTSLYWATQMWGHIRILASTSNYCPRNQILLCPCSEPRSQWAPRLSLQTCSLLNTKALSKKWETPSQTCSSSWSRLCTRWRAYWARPSHSDWTNLIPRISKSTTLSSKSGSSLKPTWPT